jgi:hypothetical protein
MIEEFLEQADAGIPPDTQQQLQSDLVEAAAVLPDAAMRLLPGFKKRCGASEAAVQAVFRAWLRTPDPGSFAQSWALAAEMMKSGVGESGPSTLCVWFGNTLRAGDSDVSPWFRRIATAYLTELVDTHFEDYAYSGWSSVAWQVMYALGPDTRAEWYRLLGDRAAERGDKRSAARRYELAERFGGDSTKEKRPQPKPSGTLPANQTPSGPKSPADRPTSPRKPLVGSDTTRRPPPPAPSRPPASSLPKLTGYVDVNRQVVLAASDVMHGRSAAARLADASEQLPDRPLRVAVTFITALSRLRENNLPKARAELRRVLSTPAEFDADRDMIANAHLILGFLDKDSRLLVVGTQALMDRYQDRWVTRSMVDPKAIWFAMAEAAAEESAASVPADEHPGGPAESGAELSAFHRGIAHASLAKAAQAALHARIEEADALLASVRKLLDNARGDQAADLRESAARIGEITARMDHSSPQPQFTRLAVAALQVDGVTHPWTPQAMRLWDEHGADDNDPITVHHQAIAEHARAYQLELDGKNAAFAHWERALHHWARLYGDPGFWRSMREHLDTVMADATPDEVVRAIEEVRAELPERLLEPHVTRIRALWRDHPPRAREHVRLIRMSPLPAAANARARSKVTHDIEVPMRRLAREGHHGPALDMAAAWLNIDPDNVQIGETAIDVGIEHVEARQSAQDSMYPSRLLLERISKMVAPIVAGLGLTYLRVGQPAGTSPTGVSETDRAAFAAKLARHEFWLGTCLLFIAYDQLMKSAHVSGGREAAEHLQRAIRLGLPEMPPYDSAHELASKAEMLGQVRRHGFGYQ